MAGQPSVNVGGTWHNVSNISANVSGAWRKVQNAFVNIGGVWRTAYNAIKQLYTAGVQNVSWTFHTVYTGSSITWNASSATLVGYAGHNTSANTDIYCSTDVTGYKTLKCQITINAGYTISCGSASTSGYGFSSGTLSLDISSISGTATITILVTAQPDSSCTANIYNVWLE